MKFIIFVAALLIFVAQSSDDCLYLKRHINSDLTKSIDVNLKSSKTADICIKDATLKGEGALVMQILPPKPPAAKNTKHKKSKIEQNINTAGTSLLYFNFESDSAPTKDSHTEYCKYEEFYETCLVTQQQLKALDGLLRFQVFCKQGPCDFQIRLESADQTLIEEVESEKFSLGPLGQSKVFLIDIPRKEDFDRLVLTLKSETNILKAEHLAIEFFTNKATQIETTNSDTRIVATLFSSDENLCSKCKVPFVISGAGLPEETHFKLTLRHYYETTEIKIDASAFQIDYLGKDTLANYYQFNLTTIEFDYLKLGLRTVSGPPKRMRAHFDEQPDELDDFGFDSASEDHDGFLLEHLILRPDVKKPEMLFVAISSDGPGAYSFLLDQEENSKLIEVEFGELIFDRVENKVVNYVLKVEPQPLESVDDFAVKLMVAATVFQDIQVAAKLCQSPKKGCKDELYDKQLEDTDSEYKFVQQSNDYLAQVNPLCKNSQQDDDGLCWIIIGISGEDMATFMLSVKETQKTITIEENVPYSALVLEDEKLHFVFYLESKKKLESLIFRVSSVNVAYMISRTCEIVTYECSSDVGTNEAPVVISGKDIQEGAYYITVIGIEPSKFSLSVETRQLDEKHIVPVTLGETYRSALTQHDPITCFQYSQEKKELLTLNIHGPKGKIILIVNEDLEDFPTREDYDDISNSQYLQVKTDKLTACVEALEHSFAPLPYLVDQTFESLNQTWMNDTLYQELHFTFTLNNPESTQQLEMNSPHYSIIQPEEQQYFTFLCDPEIANFYITRHVLSAGVGMYDDADSAVQIYIGGQPSKVSKDYEITFENYHSSTMAIDQKQLMKLCSDDDDGKKRKLEVVEYCEIFIMAKSVSKGSERYTISVYKKDIAIPLTEGHQDAYNLEHVTGTSKETSAMHFYYKPTNQVTDINVFVHSLYGKVGVQLNLWRMTEDIHRSEWPFPTQKEADFVSVHQSSIHQSIKFTSMDRCWPDCVLLISVTYLEDGNDEEYARVVGEVDIEYDDKFTIMVTQLFQDIKDGQKIELSLQPNDFKYFIFHDLTKLNQDERIALTLMQFLGRGFFTVSVSDDQNQRVPHVNGQYDFISRGTYLEITYDRLQEIIAKQGLDKQTAYLVIEVGGYGGLYRDSSMHQGSKLEFSVSLIDKGVTQVIQGVPHETLIRPTETQYFTFYNYYFHEIKVKIFRHSGFGTARLWTCKSPSTVEDCIKDSSQKTFRPMQESQLSGMSYSQFHVAKDVENGYCSYCYYILGIKSDVQEFSAMITFQVENDYVKLQNGIAYSDFVEGDNKYTAPFLPNDQIELTLQVIQGDPQIYVDYSPRSNFKDYQIGPLNLTHYHKLNNAQGNYFKLILPPREVLVENINHYNIHPLAESAILKLNQDKYDPLPLHFINDELYILVMGVANYTIQFQSGPVEAQLRDGLIHPAHLSKQNPIGMFTYEHYDAQIKPILEIMTLNGTKLENLNISVRYIPKKNHDDYSFEGIEDIILNTNTQNDNSRSYLLPEDFGLYEIRVDNIQAIEYMQTRDSSTKEIDDVYNEGDNDIYSQQFEILISGRDMIILPLDRLTSGFIDPLAVNYYEQLIQQRGYVVVEMFSCLGDMKFGYSQNQSDFLSENYTSEVFNDYGRYQHKQLKVKPGVLFMSVHSNEREQSYYLINTHFYKSSKDVPFGKLQAGNKGVITWEFVPQQLNEVKIKLYQVQCLECNNRVARRTQVDYHIYWATTPHQLSLFGHCKVLNFQNNIKKSDQFRNLPLNSFKMSIEQDYTTKQLEFTLDLTDMDLYNVIYVAVKATVQEFDEQYQIKYPSQPLEMKILYQTTEVPVPNSISRVLSKNKWFFSVIIGGLIVIIVFLVIFVAFYQRRYRQAKNLYQFEIAEIRHKVGKSQVSNEGTGLPQTYENLNEDPDG